MCRGWYMDRDEVLDLTQSVSKKGGFWESYYPLSVRSFVYWLNYTKDTIVPMNNTVEFL